MKIEVSRDFFTLKYVNDFNLYDLYSKNDKDFCLTDDVIDYYKDLLNKFKQVYKTFLFIC